MAIRLFDKRRGDNYAAIDIIQYTQFSSFLPYNTQINILTLPACRHSCTALRTPWHGSSASVW